QERIMDSNLESTRYFPYKGATPWIKCPLDDSAWKIEEDRHAFSSSSSDQDSKL
ncbi:hypothetical protein AVEN_8829-1, partial [Araneus ventricosus]